MKKISLIILLFICKASMLKAQEIKVFSEQTKYGYIIYATNNELYPISILLDLDLTNLLFSESPKKIFVVPPKSEKFTIGELNIAESRIGYSYKYKYKFTMGDVTLADYDKSFLYDLPFSKGKSYKILQGYNGIFSHQNENALDFGMPEGSEISAARDGLVVKVVENNTESCPSADCKKYNNYITIMHSDGTFASYVHIKYNGTNLTVGDSVKKGDIIAYSGNVGWSSGPHLHFVCFTGGFEKYNTLHTKFRVDKGDNSIILKEGNIYQKDY